MSRGNTKETLVDSICEQIKKDIMGQVLLPGEKINVKELTKRYGTSDTPVKLALNRLIAEQIIDNYPRQGMRVHELNAEEVTEIFDIRLMMDLYYTKEVIEAVSFSEIFREELTKNVEEHMAVVKRSMDKESVDDCIENYN